MGQDIVGILSIPQEFRISWSVQPVKNVRFKSFDDLAAQYQIPLIYVTTKMAEYRDRIAALEPDLLVAIGWYYMVPKSIRNLAKRGTVGIHASLLPRYRGGAPLVWAMINGETEAGVSLFYFEDGVDNGDIIGQISFPLESTEDIASAVNKSTAASVELIQTFVPMLANNTAPRIPQNHALAMVVPQRTPQDGKISWTAKSAVQIYNWVRAQTRPYPGAFTLFGDEKITIWKAAPVGPLAEGSQPGEIIVLDDKLFVACADGTCIQVCETSLQDELVLDGTQLIHLKKLGTGLRFQE
jgi:methionyl-tRNA formyltransferase